MKTICIIHIPKRVLVDRSLKIEILALLYTGWTRKKLCQSLSLVYWQSSLTCFTDMILLESVYDSCVKDSVLGFCHFEKEWTF